MKAPHRKVTIIGGGKVGSVLGRMLSDAGDRIVAVISRTPGSARRCARFVGCRRSSTALAEIPPETTLLFIATPHNAIEDVARSLAGLDHLRFPRLMACHASGMYTADALAPLAARGATVFSFHPLQTFPRDFPPKAILSSIPGITYGVDGSPRAVRAARRLAATLGGSVIEVPPGMRAFYHAACVLASNHLTAMLAILEEMYMKLGVSGKEFFPVFKPIIAATLKNIESTSPAEALSGPVARGGTETVAGHFDAIRKFTPGLIPYFVSLSRETVALALRKGSLSEHQAEQMLQLIQSQEQSLSRTAETT